MDKNYQVKCLYGDRAVAELSDVEREHILTNIVVGCLGEKYFDEIGAAVFDYLTDEGLINFEEAK